MDTPLVINIDTGVVAFRTQENAEQCNCRPISRKHAEMLANGELETKPLLAAIKKHMMSADDFDYEKYAAERRKLNVRHSALHADERTHVDDAKPEEYISDDEIVPVEDRSDPVEAAVAEAKKPSVKAKKSSDEEKKAGGMPDFFNK